MTEDMFEYIDVNKTIAEFGYDPRELKLKSNKRVYAICKICNNARILQLDSFSFCCKKCSSHLNLEKACKKNRLPPIKEIQSVSFINESRINRKETLKRFGYDPICLTNGSEKRVIVACPECSNERPTNFRNIVKRGAKMCFSCTRKKVSIENRGRTHTDEVKKKLSVINRGKTISDEHKERIAISARKRKGRLNPNFGKPPNHGKRSWYLKLDGSKVLMRSSWEIKYAEYLDSKDISWEFEIKYFPIIFKYKGETKEGTYTPDFYVNGEWIEIKGYWRDDAKAKFEAFKKQYPDEKISLLMRPELTALGINLR